MSQERKTLLGLSREAREARKDQRRTRTGGTPPVQPLPPRAQVTVEPLTPSASTAATIPTSNLPANVLPPPVIPAATPASTEVVDADDEVDLDEVDLTPVMNKFDDTLLESYVQNGTALTAQEEDALWDELMTEQFGFNWKSLYPEANLPAVDAQNPGVSQSGQPALPLTPAAASPTSHQGVTPAAAGTTTAYTPPSSKPERSTRVRLQHAGPTGYPTMTDDEIMADASLVRYLNMLKFMRPDQSVAEMEYIGKYLSLLPNVSKDKFGNRWVRVKKADGSDPDILFSSHTDTVHREQGKQGIMLGDGRAFTEDGSCLGADDTAGNWLMIEMINAKVPGLYIFHRAEEVGGKGSNFIKNKHGNKLKNIKAAIAFDRKGYDSVITRQSGGRCCSDKFARSLARIMGGKYNIDTGGTFTDTANYTGLVGECTNLSVGYFNAHGPLEWSDVAFLKAMRDKLINADWSQLEFDRKPGEREAGYAYGGAHPGGYGGYGGWGGLDGGYKDHVRDGYRAGGNGAAASSGTTAAAKTERTPKDPGAVIELKEWKVNQMVNFYGAEVARNARLDLREMLKFVFNNPMLVAHFLIDRAHDVDDIEAFYERYDGAGKDKWDR